MLNASKAAQFTSRRKEKLHKGLVQSLHTVRGGPDWIHLHPTQQTHDSHPPPRSGKKSPPLPPCCSSHTPSNAPRKSSGPTGSQETIYPTFQISSSPTFRAPPSHCFHKPRKVLPLLRRSMKRPTWLHLETKRRTFLNEKTDLSPQLQQVPPTGRPRATKERINRKGPG